VSISQHGRVKSSTALLPVAGRVGADPYPDTTLAIHHWNADIGRIEASAASLCRCSLECEIASAGLHNGNTRERPFRGMGRLYDTHCLIYVREPSFSRLERDGTLLRSSALLDAATGLRVSELLVLRWSDVDFENLKLNLTRSIWHQVVGNCKTEASAMPVHMDSYMAEDLLR